jgi:hypothetical protein
MGMVRVKIVRGTAVLYLPRSYVWGNGGIVPFIINIDTKLS